MCQIDSLYPCSSKDRPVPSVLFHFSQTGIYIPPDIGDGVFGIFVEPLRLAAVAAGGYRGGCIIVIQKACAFGGDEGVPGIFPLQNGRNSQWERIFRGQIFVGVYGQVDLVLQKGVVQSFSENSFSAHFNKGGGQVQTTICSDKDNFSFESELVQFTGNRCSLTGGQFTVSGPYA